MKMVRKGGEASWNKAILKKNARIQDAIQVLNETALKITIIVNDTGEIEGTISDGDIRRGLLRGLKLEDPVEGILNDNPLVVPPEVGRDLVLQLMVVNKIQQVPIVDEQRHVIGLHVWDELASPAERPNCMVIMAGGFGTRLRPHTEELPKPMLPVSDRPMLQLIIERARSQGFNRFIVAVHYLSHVIEEYFRDGSNLDVEIEYVREESPLGTAGALSLLDPRPALPFVVTNGDVLTDINYGDLVDFHVRHNAEATMAVRAYEWQHPFGVVQTEGARIVGYEEKPISRSHINAGVYVLNPGALELMEPNCSCDMPALFEKLQQKGRLTVAYPMHEPWLDVGRPDDLAAANKEDEAH